MTDLSSIGSSLILNKDLNKNMASVNMTKHRVELPLYSEETVPQAALGSDVRL